MSDGTPTAPPTPLGIPLARSSHNDVPHDHGGRDARLVRTPPSRPPTTPHCDLTLARSALLSTGARPLRRPHPASRVRWLCATPVRHARPPLALSRMSFTTSTPSPPDTHVRRPHPPACPPAPAAHVNTTPFVFALQRRPSRWPPRSGPRRSPSRSRCVISASLVHRPAHRSQSQDLLVPRHLTMYS